MKAINKIMTGLAIIALTATSAFAQPKSEIVEDNKTKINWQGADTLYTFQFNKASGSWEFFQREIRNFDAKQNPIENFVQIYVNGKWGNYLKVNYSYNELGMEIKQITQQWDNASLGWENAQLVTSTYKGKKKEEVLFQEWKRPTGEWFNIMKYLIQYNNNGDKNAVVIKLFNGVTNNWDNHKQFLMTFNNPYGPPSEVISQTWTVGEWKTAGKYDILYNWRGQKTSETRYTWNSSKKTWLEGIMQEMVYDRSGNQIEYIEKKYDIENRDWMNFNKFTATYNDQKYMTEKTEYQWNRSTNQWEEAGKFKFTTDMKI